MIELGPNARSLIELARREDDPDAATRDRLREAFTVRLNASSHPASPPNASPGLHAGSTGTAKFTGANSLIGWKGGVLLAISIAAGGTSWILSAREGDTPARPQPASTMSSRQPTSSSAPAVELRGTGSVLPEQSRAEQLPTDANDERRDLSARGSGLKLGDQALQPTGRNRANAEAAPVRTRPVRPSDANVHQNDANERPSDAPARAAVESTTHADAANSNGKDAEQLPSDELLAEARALRDAQQALRAGQSKRALNLLAEQERRFPKGQLSEARAAARAMAACAAQSAAQARLTAAAFIERWSRSPLVSSVRAACLFEQRPAKAGRD